MLHKCGGVDSICVTATNSINKKRKCDNEKTAMCIRHCILHYDMTPTIKLLLQF